MSFAFIRDATAIDSLLPLFIFICFFSFLIFKNIFIKNYLKSNGRIKVIGRQNSGNINDKKNEGLRQK